MAMLSFMDVKKLSHEPSPKVRGMLAAKIAMDYQSGDFNPTEAQIADDIFRILLKDAEKQVRLALSEQLSRCPKVPHDIIAELAHDKEWEVASPVLEYSTVLTDSDLMAVVESTKEVSKLMAIARRYHVSKPLSDILLDTQQEEVVHTLIENKGATLSEYSLTMALPYVETHPRLLEALVLRGNLPLTVAEKIYHAVTEELQDHLIKHYKIKVTTAVKATTDTREWQMLDLAPADGVLSPQNDDQVNDLIDQLYMGNRLTHSFLMRALCVGSLSLFEAGIARLADVPRVNARILLTDSSKRGFHALYEAAHMPAGFYDAVATLMRISLEESDFGFVQSSDFRKRVIDRIYKEGLNRSVENMEYLLAIVGGKVTGSVH